MSRLQNRMVASVALGALALALSAPAAFAQQTTASVGGFAVDEKGAPISGATVTVTHVPSGTQAHAVTDAAGAFELRGLRVGGPYRITATANGFAAQTIEGTYLNVADIRRVQLALAPSAEVSELVVTAAKKKTTTQLANVGSRTTLESADIGQVVSIKRDIRDIGRRDPLANLDLVNRGTGPSGGLYIAGSSPRRNRITIDGVRSQDDFGLNTGGLSTNRGPVSFEAIEEASIQAVPFDVEEGDFTGGALNLILKSGGNRFHGSLFDFQRSNTFVGDKVPIVGFPGNDVAQPPLTGYRTLSNYIHEENYGGFLSGPIIKDKLFFAVSYEDYESNDVTGTGPAGGGFANVFNHIPGSANANATQGDIDGILANYVNGYAVAKTLPPGQVDLYRPIKDEKYSVKIDWNIDEHNRLTATYRHAFSSVWKRSPSTTSISLDTNWYVQPESEDNYSLQLNSTWNPKFATEARFSYRGYTRGQLPPEGQDFANLGICTDITSVGSTRSCSSGVPSIQIGPDQFRQANKLATNDYAAELIGYYHFNAAHDIKFGYQLKAIDVYDLFVQAAHGVYYFDSQADFAAGRANSLSYGGALDGNLNDAAEIFNYQTHTFLAQDTWRVTDNLTVNYGVRADYYAQADKPTLNSNFVGRYGFSNQKTYDGQIVVQPRLSAKYLTQTFELSGGVGRVSGGIPDVFIGNSYGAQTGALSNSFQVVRNADGTFTNLTSGALVDPAVGGSLLNNLNTNSTFINTPSSAVNSLIQTPSATQRLAFTNSLSPNFKLPADWKANVSFRTSKFGFDFGIDGVYTVSDTNVAFRDIRARPLTINGVQQYTPDGRIRYDGLAGLTATQRTAAGLPVSSNPDLLNISNLGDIQAYNPGVQNWAATVAFSVAKKWRGLDAQLSYTYQDAENFGGISEFGTTAGGNSSSGNYYADQTSYLDPNTSVLGKAGNLIRDSWKFDVSYKLELFRGFASHFTLFAESHSGRPINFLMSDPANAGGSRSPTFGVFRDDQLAYIPNLGSPDPTNPLKFTTGSATVFFANQTALNQFAAVVNQFHLPLGKVVPKGFGTNPSVNRIDFQYAQEIASPIKGHELLFTVDIANLGNLLNKGWGVVKEYTNARAGGIVINAQCADATGAAAAVGSAVCSTYRYSYTTVSAATLATPTVDPVATQWSVEFGLKYKF